MPKISKLRLARLLEAGDRICLSPGFRAVLFETARVSLDHNSHSTGTRLHVQGHFKRSFRMEWEAATEEDRRTYADLDVAVEHAAYGLAFLLVVELTEHYVIKRSAKGTGFDYWLGEKKSIGFQEAARLEVSGILSNPGGVNARTTRKAKQTRRSDHVILPALVVVVEFSKPLARITKR